MTTSMRTSARCLFDRVGGFDKVGETVGRLFERMARDPVLSGLLPGVPSPDLRWQVQLLLTDLLGGPMAYDGPEPGQVADGLSLDEARARRLLTEIVGSFADGGADTELAQSIEAQLEAYLKTNGLGVADSFESPGTAAGGGEDLLSLAGQVVAAAGLTDWNLFVLDPALRVAHVSAEAVRAVQACETELRRAFNLGATDLMRTSVLRFHSAPTQLQAALADHSRSCHDTTWSFGQAVWKARFLAVRGPGGALLGYAVPWRDESEIHRRQDALQRLRNQSEDLPVPVMFPDASCERWFGNAACQQALHRLTPHLPGAPDPVDGVPIAIFFPDPEVRRVLFHDPDRLPHKAQVQIGPETVAILVTPVRDKEQRFLGPQITWEIVHFTPRAEEPATPTVSGPIAATARALHAEARNLGSAADQLQTLSRLLDAAAGGAEAQPYVAGSAEPALLQEVERLLAGAQSVLAAVREMPPSPGRRKAASHALETITGFARRTNQVAVDAALLAVQDDVTHAAEGLRADSRALTDSMREQMEALTVRARTVSETVQLAMVASARLEQLRGSLAESGGAAAQ